MGGTCINNVEHGAAGTRVPDFGCTFPASPADANHTYGSYFSVSSRHLCLCHVLLAATSAQPATLPAGLV